MNIAEIIEHFRAPFYPRRENTLAQIRAWQKCYCFPRFQKTDYSFLFEDTGHTGNINMHTTNVYCISPVEALAKALDTRPEFVGRKIIQINRVPFLDFIKTIEE